MFIMDTPIRRYIKRRDLVKGNPRLSAAYITLALNPRVNIEQKSISEEILIIVCTLTERVDFWTTREKKLCDIPTLQYSGTMHTDIAR